MRRFAEKLFVVNKVILIFICVSLVALQYIGIYVLYRMSSTKINIIIYNILMMHPMI